jgi:hypothetical protein
MERLGRFVFAGGAAVSVLAGVITTLNLGTICALGEGPPASMLSYPALCFMFWAYGVPLGLILAATGVLMMAGTPGGRTAAFAVGVFVVYAAIVIANDPMPHVPPLFGIGGALILGFYFAILWMHAATLPATCRSSRVTHRSSPGCGSPAGWRRGPITTSSARSRARSTS